MRCIIILKRSKLTPRRRTCWTSTRRRSRNKSRQIRRKRRRRRRRVRTGRAVKRTTPLTSSRRGKTAWPRPASMQSCESTAKSSTKKCPLSVSKAFYFYFVFVGFVLSFLILFNSFIFSFYISLFCLKNFCFIFFGSCLQKFDFYIFMFYDFLFFVMIDY